MEGSPGFQTSLVPVAGLAVADAIALPSLQEWRFHNASRQRLPGFPPAAGGESTSKNNRTVPWVQSETPKLGFATPVSGYIGSHHHEEFAFRLLKCPTASHLHSGTCPQAPLLPAPQTLEHWQMWQLSDLVPFSLSLLGPEAQKL